MNLDISNWETFLISDIFHIFNGKGITLEEIDENPGEMFAIQSGSENNGCIGKIDKHYCIEHGYTYTEEPCLTVARTGSAGFVAYQHYGCVVGDSAKILLLKNEKERCTSIYLFLRTVLMALQYKYTYGRKVTEKKYLAETILLPAVGKDKPDWNFMKCYITSLNHKIPTTSIIAGNEMELDTSEWKEFLISKLFHASMGNGIDAVLTTSVSPRYNYVSRDSDGNGVVGFVDEIDGEIPFPEGTMTIALGGSFLGSCFVQKKPFYTAQNVGVLREKFSMSIYSKLFIATLIRNECRTKYQAFGRELNAHFRKDFTIKLPIKKNGENILIDTSKEFSDKGYVPDWEWIDEYMKNLPYSDRI